MRRERPDGRTLPSTTAAAQLEDVGSTNGTFVGVQREQRVQITAVLTNPSQSLIARVSLGQNPIGLAFVKDGREIVVADADSIKRPGEGNLALISTQRALQTPSRGALLGYIPAGTPRELAVEPGGNTLLATDNNSGQLQAVDVGSLP